MKILENNRIRALGPVLPFASAVIPLLFSLYFWTKGWTEPATTFLLLGIGLILLGILLIRIKKITGNNRRFVIVVAALLFSIGLYCWIGRGYIYTGIFAMLTGVVSIFSEYVKGKWWQIGVTVAFALAVGTLVYLEETEEDKRHTVGREVGAQLDAGDKASKPNEVPSGKASVSPEQQTVDMMNQILTAINSKIQRFRK